MKKAFLFIVLTALLVITGCSTATVPSTPKPHPEKYALQILRIEAPASSTKIPELTLGFSLNTEMRKPPAIADLLNNPDAKVYELPVVYAGIGETAINDQTKIISAPKSYEPKVDTNGIVSVVYSDDTTKVGQYVEWTLQKVENGEVTCDLWFFDKSLVGSFKYEVAPATKTQDAVTAFMPKFKALEMKTKISITPGNWIPMGGLSAAKNPTLVTDRHLFVQILPPQK